jgi:hypothetical protein
MTVAEASGRTPRITEERWATLHPKLKEVFVACMGCPGAVEVTGCGLIIYCDQSP